MLMPNTIGNNTITAITIMTQLIMFNQNPVLAISRIETLPVPKTIAFGGVPTGSMNAQFAAIAAGTINASGCTFIDTASAASNGRIIVAVAVFDVISVKNSTNNAVIVMINIIGNPLSKMSWSLSHASNLLVVIAFASANPPPNNSSTPHGISLR